ncbi:MAG: HD domain-containing phosphohydrolase [Velocimicrobium sp.]
MIISRKKKVSLKKEYIRICITYLVIGFIWVYFSDSATIRFIKSSNLLRLANTYKGFLYIFITTILLYHSIEKLIQKVQLTEKELRKSKAELVETNEELQLYVEQISEAEEELRAQYEQMLEYDKNLATSEEKYKTLIAQMQLGLALYEGTTGQDIKDFILVEVNSSHEILTGIKKEAAIGRRFDEIHPTYEQEYLSKMRNIIKTGEPCSYERYKKETNIYYEILAYRPKENQLAVIINNISKRKKMEEELQFLSYHDQLTGLYNRRYFDQVLKRLNHTKYMPLSITIADINGLKLINDSFGNMVGDQYIVKIADTLKKAYREDDTICRLSGDEFVVLSPKTEMNMAESLMQKVYKSAKKEKVNEMDLSISIGFSTKFKKDQSSLDVFKKAEDYMYRRKLYESPSMRGKTITTIITTLHEKNPREELHSRRVSQLCEKMGTILMFSEDKVKELKMVGLLHDIGKIAIDERILNKPDKLEKEEWEEIKKHPAIGYRILSTVNDLAEMAEYVLAHHERWDGTGYPKGLKGEDIPMESRIIAIADSYDAMISERSYRSALSKKIAIDELIKNAGTQFSPELVSIFVKKVV